MDNIFHKIILKVQILAFFPTYPYIRKSIHHPALPSPSTTKTPGASRFNHDPLGQRIEKRYYLSWAVPEQRNITYYVRDAQGNVMATNSREVDEWMPTDNYRLADWTLYGSSRLGLVKGTEFGTLGSVSGPEWQVTLSFVKNRVKQYELTNHASTSLSAGLGNVLAIVSGEKDYLDTTGTGTWSYSIGRVLNAQDYYPFGATMPGRTYNSTDYRYGYQNQEKDDEVKGVGNHIDFKYRGYDPRLGRFWKVDPLFQKYPSLSPYHFSHNSPIGTVEIEGLEGEEVRFRMWMKAQGGVQAQAQQHADDMLRKGNGVVAEVMLGFVPYVAQAIDAKDTYQAFKSGDGWDKTFAMIAWIPGGDIFKGARKLVKGADNLSGGFKALNKLDGAASKIDNLLSGNKSLKESFAGGKYDLAEATEDITVYRVSGGTSTAEGGEFFTTIKPNSSKEAESLLNINKHGNLGTEVTPVTIKKGTQFATGAVDGGKGTQIFIPSKMQNSEGNQVIRHLDKTEKLK